jgi:hypothetical protein
MTICGMSEHFRAPSQVHARRFDHEIVVLHLGLGKYFALDAVGSTIWDALTAGRTPDEAVLALVSEYEVDASTARADVLRLTGELVDAGLLERTA